MDEQEIIATQDFSEPEPENIEPREPDFTEPQPPELPELKEDWGITEDGEVNFNDNYLGEVEKSFFPERTPEEPAEDASPEQVQAQPKYYTPEELANTPYEQWDINRLNGDIKKFCAYSPAAISSKASTGAGSAEAAGKPVK